MIHPDTELSFISEEIGFGLVATRFIAAGTITWVKDPLDMVFDSSKYSELEVTKKDYLFKYCFVDGNGYLILCWDHGRFVNHSCQANCLAPGFDFEIAVRDIQPGEQLTSDYGVLNMMEDFNCSCKGCDCRKIIRASDPELMHKIWDDKIKRVFNQVDKVEQPLWEMIIDKERVMKAIATPNEIPSSLNHYFRSSRD